MNEDERLEQARALHKATTEKFDRKKFLAKKVILLRNEDGTFEITGITQEERMELFELSKIDFNNLNETK